jgi:GntR family transcriptional regulator
MRQIAAELHIALNTIVKAYAELEAQGIIETRAGAGTAIAAGVDSLFRRQAIEQLRHRLREITGDAAALGVSEGELSDWFAAETRRAYPLPADDSIRREG